MHKDLKENKEYCYEDTKELEKNHDDGMKLLLTMVHSFMKCCVSMDIEIRRATPKGAFEIAVVAAYSWLESYQGLINQEYLNDKISKQRLEYSTNKTKTLIENLKNIKIK